MIRPNGWNRWSYFQKLRNLPICLGTFPRPKPSSAASQVFWQHVQQVQVSPWWLPDQTHVNKIVNWGPCKDLSEVRAFLSTVGICHIFIQNFAKHANALVNLTQKSIPFEFSPAQIEVQEDLKQALLNSLALQPIDYQSDSPVILAVDTSQITVGFYLCQADPVMPMK